MKEKKNRITITIIFTIIIIGSILIAYNIKNSPSNLPLAVFSIACTILIASLALPSLLGISDSKIVKGLFFILYNDFIHIFFPIYQAMLAVVALITEYSQAGSNFHTFMSRLLLVLMIFDLFYILLYLHYLINVIGSPGKMLRIFENRILNKIKRRTKKGREEEIYSEIQMLVKISKDTCMGDEKSAALSIFNKLLEEITRLPAKSENIPTEWQYKLWKLLIENVSEICHNHNDLYSANDKNVSRAIDILNNSWQLITHWRKTGFDYTIFTRTLKKIAYLAIKKSYNDSVHKVVAVLGKMGEQALSNQATPHVTPSEIASDMAELGIFGAKAGKDDLTYQLINHLLSFYNISQKEEYLFWTLRLMSFIWDNNKDALEDLGRHLIEMERIEIESAVEYGSICYLRETVRIKRFLDAVANLPSE